jgi:hypothetical protein
LSLGAIEEIQQKNIIFPEFLRSIRQYLLGFDLLPAKGGLPEVFLQLSMQIFQAITKIPTG